MTIILILSVISNVQKCKQRTNNNLEHQSSNLLLSVTIFEKAPEMNIPGSKNYWPIDYKPILMTGYAFMVAIKIGENIPSLKGDEGREYKS